MSSGSAQPTLKDANRINFGYSFANKQIRPPMSVKHDKVATVEVERLGGKSLKTTTNRPALNMGTSTTDIGAIPNPPNEYGFGFRSLMTKDIAHHKATSNYQKLSKMPYQ